MGRVSMQKINEKNFEEHDGTFFKYSYTKAFTLNSYK